MTQDLLAYISSDFSERHVEELRSVIAGLATLEWSVGPPQFVDEVDESSCTRPEDEPVRTVGVLLAVSAVGEYPATPVAEPARIIEALEKFSRAHELEFEVQLDYTYIGDIKDGIADRDVREGLLAQW